MTNERREAAINVDQFIAAPPERVWRFLTEPELHARWWVPGDVSGVVGHKFDLRMPGFGDVACEIVASDPPRSLAYTFNGDWTISWKLVPEGRGTRLLLEHSGFDLDDPRAQDAFGRMGPGWRDVVVPALARAVAAVNA